MSYKVLKQKESELQLSFTVEPADYQADLESAAKKLSARVAVKGFRKGNVPYDVMKKEVGEMAILQEALQTIVQREYLAAVKDLEADIVGTPKIELNTVAPGNALTFEAKAALIPEVNLPKLDKISVSVEKKAVDKKKIDETVDAVRGMHAVEKPKDGAATGSDKLMIDMNMSLDGVPIEGGQAKDYQVYLSEDHYIPGFNKEVEGLKKGDKKSFTIDFPESHYQKQLAGKNVAFDVSVNEVLERILPEANDELAKKLGQESMEELRKLIESNLEKEAEQKANQAAEIEMLDKLIEKTSFGTIPEVIVDAERTKMFYELKADIEKNGITIDQYLADIKKTEKELYEGFKEQAEKRAKAALLSRQVAKEQNLLATDEEIEAELEKMREMYKNNKEYLDRVNSAEAKETIATTIQNRKVMDYLKEQIIKQ